MSISDTASQHLWTDNNVSGSTEIYAGSWGPIHKKSYDKLRKNLG